MTKRERPPAVTRYLRSPLWLLPFAGVVLAALFFLVDLPATSPERLDRREEVAVTGRLLAPSGDEGLRVQYVHPVTEQEVTADLHVGDRSLLPPAGQEVRVIARRDDPLGIALEGDTVPLTANLSVYVAAMVAALLPVVARRVSVRRTEQLIAADETSFAMVGAVSPRPLRRFRCDLHLYPLDAPAEASPVCTVPLLTTAQAPIGGGAFPVEIKGSPRPLGRVVARSGDALLWPASRAGRRADHPRPLGDPTAIVGLVAAPKPPPGTPLPSGWLRAVRREAIGLGLTLGLMVVLTAATFANQRDARRVDRAETSVVGEVIAHESDGSIVVLRYEDGGEQRITRAGVDFGSDYRKGIRYPARLDPDDPSRARLVAEPYDTTEPLVWAALPVLVATGVLRSRWRNWRRNRRAAREGPWWYADAHRVDDANAVITDATLHPVCGALVTGPRTTLVHTVPVLVAGPAEPGAPIAVWQRGELPLGIVRPATNGRSSSAFDV